jgi:hypothetical protein
MQGTMLEKFLTHSQEDFGHFLRDTPITKEVEQLKRPEAYRYARVGL